MEDRARREEQTADVHSPEERRAIRIRRALRRGQADNPAEDTCVIITTEANAMMSQIHHRMPVIMEPADESAWLNHRENRTTQLLKLLRQYSAEALESFPVSSLVNTAALDRQPV